MYLNGWSVRIPQGIEENGYVPLPNKKVFTIQLRNQNAVRGEAYVEISGKHVGIWRLEAHQSITLDYPASDPQKGLFTFYETDSTEGKEIGLTAGNPNAGLIKVTFTPELRPVYTMPQPPYYQLKGGALTGLTGIDNTQYGALSTSAVTNSVPRSMSIGAQYNTASSYTEGDVGASGQSSNQYGVAMPLMLDQTQQSVVHVRLVCKKDGPRPLVSYSTPIPPAVR
jgi:hypothetical protein